MLEVTDLSVAYLTRSKNVEALHHVSIHIKEKEVYGLMGESGAGKTTLGLSILRCLDNAVKEQGKIRFLNQDLMNLSPHQLRALWGKEIGYVPQDALSALNPSLKIGEQIEEILRLHLDLDRFKARKVMLEWLSKVKIANPEVVASSYPHQLSGGMLQRVMLAMALCPQPRFIILDEPTSHLDVTTQAFFLALLKRIINQEKLTILYISHNLKTMRKLCTRVGVLYGGELVEEGEIEELFENPLHPYTQTLLSSSPDLDSQIERQRLSPLRPNLASFAAGCHFQPHCPWADHACQNHPSIEAVHSQHKVRCFRWQFIQQTKTAGLRSRVCLDEHQTHAKASNRHLPETHQPYLKLEQYSVTYPSPTPRLLPFHRNGNTSHESALNNATLFAYRQQTLGIVGESGSGKTTLARAILGFIQENESKNPPNALQLWMDNAYVNLPNRLSQRPTKVLRQMQMIFQNIEESLNPYIKIGEMLERPMMRLLGYSPEQAKQNAASLLNAVLLSEDYLDRFPTQLSGGEKQRVAIARAFASRPILLICDEGVSALDSTLQTFVLNLLHDMREKHLLSLWIISHDISVINYLADEIIVMLKGHIVERSSRAAFLHPPYHPYTFLLLKAAKEIVLDDVPDEINEFKPSPHGCFYAKHCSRRMFLEKNSTTPLLCLSDPPIWKETAAKSIYCHYPIE